MHGWRSPVHVVTSLTMLGLSLFAVTTARAQTPNVAVDGTSARKPVVEATAPKTTEATEPKASEPATKTDAAVAKTDATPATPAADPAQPIAQATPTPPPCPAGTRLVKADVVAIPKAIMLNRQIGRASW